MARSKSPLLLHSEYWGVRGASALLSRLPQRLAIPLIASLLQVWLGFNRSRRIIALDNIRRAFPEKGNAQQRAILQQSLRYLAKGALALLDTPGLLRRNEMAQVRADGLEHVHAALKKGHGLIAFSAHVGSWELMTQHTMWRFPGITGGVYRALDNTMLDAWVREMRDKVGGTLIERHALLKKGMQWLKKNHILGILVDQHFADGIWVPFFGRLAATVPIVSILARRTGAAVLPVNNYWEGDRLRVVWEAPLPLSTNPDPAQAVQEDTAAMTLKVEQWIRQNPSQWLWVHNRWKNSPTP